MKLAIVGTRRIQSYGLFLLYLKKAYPDLDQVTELVSGGAVGVDTFAERLAQELGKPIKVFLPEYSKYGKRATLLRNTQIAEYADMGIALVDKESVGTYDTVRKFRALKKAVVLVDVSEEQRVLDSYLANNLCDPGFESILEDNRKQGMFNSPCPPPNFRIHLNVKGAFQEGGYFHYRNDALRVQEFYESLGVQTTLEELNIK